MGDVFMKKFLLILAVVFVFTIGVIPLTGCGSKDGPKGGRTEDFDDLHISAIIE